MSGMPLFRVMILDMEIWYVKRCKKKTPELESYMDIIEIHVCIYFKNKENCVELYFTLRLCAQDHSCCKCDLSKNE